MNEKNQPLCVVIKKQGTVAKAVGAVLAGVRSLLFTGILGVCFTKSALDLKKQLDKEMK